MNKQWWKKAVIYQIYPKSFCDSDNDGIGDLQGIISKLDYIKALGADIIWLSPIYQSPDKDNGYDISDYRSIQPVYGTMNDFDELLAKTHALGMKLVMDLVVNHTSNQHPWYLDSMLNKNSKYHDYYYWRKGKFGKEPNNWHAYFSGSAWTYSPEIDEYSLGVFSPFQPDLNWHNKDLRNDIYDMMRFWLDKGIDGFRLDAIHCAGKTPDLPDSDDGMPIVKQPCIHDFLFEMNAKVLSKYDIMTVGEASGLSVEDMTEFAGENRHELNMMIQFSHVELDEKGGKWTTDKIYLPELKKLMNKWQTGIYGKAWNSLYWNNHDQPRVVSRLGSTDENYRELSAQMIATNTQLMCGTPFIYQGEELGMTNVNWTSTDELRDLESINAYNELVGSNKKTAEEMLACISSKGRDNARTPMQWNDSKNGGFSVCKPWIASNKNYVTVNAAEQENRSNSVLNYYRKLIKLRKENEIAVFGTYEGLDFDNEQVFAYKRALDGTEWIVICNFSSQSVGFEWQRFFSYNKVKTVIGNYSGSDYLTSNTLKPYETIVLSNEV